MARNFTNSNSSGGSRGSRPTGRTTNVTGVGKPIVKAAKLVNTITNKKATPIAKKSGSGR